MCREFLDHPKQNPRLGLEIDYPRTQSHYLSINYIIYSFNLIVMKTVKLIELALSSIEAHQGRADMFFLNSDVKLSDTYPDLGNTDKNPRFGIGSQYPVGGEFLHAIATKKGLAIAGSIPSPSAFQVIFGAYANTGCAIALEIETRTVGQAYEQADGTKDVYGKNLKDEDGNPREEGFEYNVARVVSILESPEATAKIADFHAQALMNSMANGSTQAYQPRKSLFATLTAEVSADTSEETPAVEAEPVKAPKAKTKPATAESTSVDA